MATTSNESLSELERRAETSRAELAQTVDALQARVSPSALKADLKDYVRENPLQAAAIAVGVAYPVWRIIGSIPAPVMLIGAGLALSHRSGVSQGNISSGSGGGMVTNLKEKASSLGTQLTAQVHDTIDTVRSMASDRMVQASEVLSGTRDAAADSVQQVSGQVSEAYVRTLDSVADVIDRHPLMVGGLAFAVGSIVAAAVPVSRPETRVLGETIDEFRRRAGDMALRGMREVKSAAQRVYEKAADEVRSQGLTPEAARNAARAAVETARGAMEHASTETSSHNS